eukprot:CAMPEP_0117421138 /NCGR_PEP_ID=MMETSP0758-20121206/2309_1 /TAXON_ID=63605 /ORGANISM="Percolomonas cosmopolitus, Strain AE-1 (ATCC 50343)" /LENGTH=331 /DNA_ID=CAMNT_0005203121 /DNA_START=581 /DNA_END=1572 /DNA_ORIENTATION=+
MDWEKLFADLPEYTYFQLVQLLSPHHPKTNTHQVMHHSLFLDLLAYYREMTGLTSSSIAESNPYLAKVPNVQWNDIGGLESAKTEILNTVQLPLLKPELFQGSNARSGILLYGPPGTGKTLLAKAVATECSLKFMSVKGPELINSYVGESERNIRELFEAARLCSPCIIFFDELDALTPARGRQSSSTLDRIVSQFVTELNSIASLPIFVMGATNRVDLVDSSLLRPGRFDVTIEIPVCSSSNDMLSILKALTRKFKLHESVSLDSIVSDHCKLGMTGADLMALSSDAILSAVLRCVETSTSKVIVHQDDFIKAASHIEPSLTPEEVQQYA